MICNFIAFFSFFGWNVFSTLGVRGMNDGRKDETRGLLSEGEEEGRLEGEGEELIPRVESRV